MTKATAVVRPLPGSGLVARAGDLLLVCADGGQEVDDLLRLVAEVAAAGADGGVLVRRVAALLAADFDGNFPACAASGPTRDGRLAVLVYGAATADVMSGDGDIRLAGSDAITSVNRLIAGPVTEVRLRLPGAGSADPRSRLDSGVVAAAGVVYSPVSSFGSAPEPVSSFGSAPDTSSTVDGGFTSFSSYPPPPPRHPDSLTLVPLPAEAPAPPVSYPLPFAAPSPLPAPSSSAPPAETPAASPVAVAQTVEPVRVMPLPPVHVDPLPPPPARIPEAPGPADPVAGEAAQLREPDPAAPFVAVLLVPGAQGLGADGLHADGSNVDGVGADNGGAGESGLGNVRPNVLGVLCGNGHFCDPNLPYCGSCGVSMDAQTLVMREGPRPPLGVLVLDDGMMFRLDVDYVIGREPQADPGVIAGTIRPLRISDADGVVSRRHLRVTLTGWEAQVVDLGSANGTYVDRPGDPERHQLIPNQPIVVRHGTQVTMGRRWFRYESYCNL